MPAHDEYDPFDHRFHDDPYPTYAYLQEHRPVHHVARHDFWVLSRFDDVQQSMRNWQVFSSAKGNVIDDPPERIGRTLGTTDPPLHDALRRAVVPRFTTRKMTELGDVVADMSRELLTGWSPGSDFDLVGQFAAPLTSRLMGDLLGIPRSDHEQLKQWREAMVHREPDKMGFTAEGQESFVGLVAYMRELVADRAREPQDDLVSDLVSLGAEHVDLDHETVAVTALTVLGAGYQSVNYLVVNALHALGTHPDVLERVAAAPDDVDTVLEELMRWDSPTQGFARCVTEDHELHGITIPSGARVLMLLGAANRDPRVFERPDEIDLDRPRSTHLSFGTGPHFCIGAALGRIAGRAALSEFVRLAPVFEVDRTTYERVHSPTFRGFTRLIARAPR